MSVPQPPEIILPSGETAYLNPYRGTYTTSRSYALRMQRNYARGISQGEARGHAPGQVSESELRRIRFEQKYGIPYRTWERFRRKYISKINKRSWPGGPRTMQLNEFGNRSDPRVFISDILAIRQLYDSGFRDPVTPVDTWEQYAEVRLSQRLNALVMYQDHNDSDPGRSDYNSRSGIWYGEFGLGASAPPVELWYYH